MTDSVIFSDRAYDSADEIEFFRILATAENGSQHPLASAIIEHAHFLGVSPKHPSEFQSHPGLGIECVIDHKFVVVGNKRMMESRNVDVSFVVENATRELENQAKTVILVSVDNSLIGLCAVGDTIRQEAKATISKLRSTGIDCWMITGDNHRTASVVASQLGIENVFSEVLPNQKAEKVAELQRAGNVVAFVGDGVNDSPALVRRDCAPTYIHILRNFA